MADEKIVGFIETEKAVMATKSTIYISSEAFVFLVKKTFTSKADVRFSDTGMSARVSQKILFISWPMMNKPFVLEDIENDGSLDFATITAGLGELRDAIVAQRSAAAPPDLSKLTVLTGPEGAASGGGGHSTSGPIVAFGQEKVAKIVTGLQVYLSSKAVDYVIKQRSWKASNNFRISVEHLKRDYSLVPHYLHLDTKIHGDILIDMDTTNYSDLNRLKDALKELAQVVKADKAEPVQPPVLPANMVFY